MVRGHFKTNSAYPKKRTSEISPQGTCCTQTKENLDELYEVLAPGSTSGKLSSSGKVIMKPNKPEVRVLNTHTAKCGTKHERDTNLAQYADRTPPKINGKMLEQKIRNHKKDFLRTDGSKRTKRSKKHFDDVSVTSSV